MRHKADLRGRLASGRGLGAAVVAALGAFAPVALAESETPPGPAWTLAWAELQVRSQFEATSVACVPFGRAVKVNGTSAFREFLCGLVLTDGTRVTIRLKPRSRTAWKTLSQDRVDPSPDKPGGADHGAGKGQTGQAGDNGHGQGTEKAKGQSSGD